MCNLNKTHLQYQNKTNRDPKQWVSMDVLKNINLVLYFSSAKFVKNLAQNKTIEETFIKLFADTQDCLPSELEGH